METVSTFALLLCSLVVMKDGSEQTLLNPAQVHVHRLHPTHNTHTLIAGIVL